ncbi:MAG: DUF134 domain-containing protein [Cyclobacteriaceae bacterium]
MPRKKCLRYIAEHPEITFYKPAGIPLRKLSETVVTLDEFEALRLADAEGMYHNEAADKMQVSRQTFGRIITSARKKIATAILAGHAIKIEGGNVNIQNMINHENSSSQPQ